MAEAGLKLWITELTILESNSTKKAAALEDVLTLYYSHPAVEGIMLWGFWDGAAFDTRISLFTGSKITVCLPYITRYSPSAIHIISENHQ